MDEDAYLVVIKKNNYNNHATKVGEKHYFSVCDFHIGIKMALQGGTAVLILK